MFEQALSDLKVVEFGELVSAPYCGKLLADLGAEVIKVEVPGRGDVSRRLGPFPDGIPNPEQSGLFLYLNANKFGVTLNPFTSAGRELMIRLLGDADVLVDNNPPRVMEELGLTYDALCRENPRLIVTSITPYGWSGPHRDHQAGNLGAWHAGGLGYLWREREPEKEPGLPLKAGGRIADFQAAANAAAATVCAVFARGKTGRGQLVDISAQECIASMLGAAIITFGWNGVVQGKGPSLPVVIPFGAKQCQDGEVVMSGREEHQWQGLMDLIGNPDWSQDEWCRDRLTRFQYWQEIDSLMSDWLHSHSRDEIVEGAQARRVPASKTNTVGDLANDKHLKAREYFLDVEHPAAGRFRYPTAPYRLSETPWRFRRPAPLLGQHNEDIYGNRLGHSAGDLAALREAGII